MERSNWAKREIKRLLALEGTTLDLIAIHEAAEELSLESPLLAMQETRTRIVTREVRSIGRLQVPVRSEISTAGFLYVIRCGGKYKIGSARDVGRRLRQLQTSAHKTMSIVLTVKTDFRSSLEKTVHRAFAHRRVRGEWYELTSEDLRWLKTL